jgi:hypothetical protein
VVTTDPVPGTPRGEGAPLNPPLSPRGSRFRTFIAFWSYEAIEPGGVERDSSLTKGRGSTFFGSRNSSKEIERVLSSIPIRVRGRVWACKIEVKAFSREFLTR